jgi:16S rRNA (guanine527-N7)-methyltransferase
MAFLDLFEKWNHSINLSAASTRAELQEHLNDSRHVLPFITDRARVLDVGAGGGFPVVVAAIHLPSTQFVALEPVHKKHAFLRTAVRELGLSNLTPLAERLEDHETHDYDAAMSRATFDLNVWLEVALDHVNQSGIAIGFEAVLRADLPPAIERHPYSVAGKQRAIVIARR